MGALGARTSVKGSIWVLYRVVGGNLHLEPQKERGLQGFYQV